MKSLFISPRLIAVLICFGWSSWIYAQGTLKAKVTDEKGQPLYGVIVVAMENQSILNRTEPDGSFELKFPDSKLYTLNFVLMSYGTGAVMAVPGHDARDWEFAKNTICPSSRSS